MRPEDLKKGDRFWMSGPYHTECEVINIIRVFEIIEYQKKGVGYVGPIPTLEMTFKDFEKLCYVMPEFCAGAMNTDYDMVGLVQSAMRGPKCECGLDATRHGGVHSSYCPKRGE